VLPLAVYVDFPNRLDFACVTMNNFSVGLITQNRGCVGVWSLVLSMKQQEGSSTKSVY